MKDRVRRMKYAVYSAIIILPLSGVAVCSDGPRPLLQSGSTYFVPTAANAPGLHGAYFRTRVSILIPNGDAGLHLAITAITPSGPLSSTIWLQPGRPVYYDNILDDLFHYTGGAALAFSSEPSSHVIPYALRAEVYSASGAGRTTTPLPVLTASDAVGWVDPIGKFETYFSLSIGITSDATTRVNIGCGNFDSAPVSVNAQLWGTAWSYRFGLAPGQWQQVPVSPPSDLDPASVWVMDFVTDQSAQRDVFCYAVNVDNESNDGTLIPAAVTPQGPTLY